MKENGNNYIPTYEELDNALNTLCVIAAKENLLSLGYTPQTWKNEILKTAITNIDLNIGDEL